MPLVRAGGQEACPDEPTRRARKVSPRLARGEPERVAVVANLAEGELVQGILLEEGIPSYLRRSAGFDVPDFLAAGPRDVMVPGSAVETARGLLRTGVAADGSGDEGVQPSSRRAVLRFAAALLAALLLFGVIAGLLLGLLA